MSDTGEMPLDCPNCGKNAKMIETSEDVPHFGETVISTLSCEHCGFKMNDIMAAEQKPPRAYMAEVKGTADLETKLVKSSTGTVDIKEFGIRIEPGPAADGYITNIEGLLEKMIAATKVLVDTNEEDMSDEKKLARKELNKLKDAKKGLIHFRVIVEDPLGNSALLGKNVKFRDLHKEEIENLLEKIEGAEEELPE